MNPITTASCKYIYSEPPDKQAKVILLTKDGIATLGPWKDGLGVIAWHPLPKRDKSLEDRLK